MTENIAEKYWRIRMRYTGDKENKDYSKDAWKRDEVGIWYGAWSATDFEMAIKSENPESFLNQIPTQMRMPWQVRANTIHMARRFDKITRNDWVIVCYGNAIHMARVDGPMTSESDHPLNQKEEVWKYRPVTAKKQCLISKLPDFYNLIPQTGRSNVYELWGNNWEAIRFLASCINEREVGEKFGKMTDNDRLSFLGPKAWESFCLGYLILEEGFVPTGLTAGGTLKSFDIVGRNHQTGERILAQCKKDELPVKIESGFLTAIEGAQQDAKILYFAFGGCVDAPPHVKVIDKTAMETWVKSGEGGKYLQRFFNTNL